MTTLPLTQTQQKKIYAGISIVILFVLLYTVLGAKILAVLFNYHSTITVASFFVSRLIYWGFLVVLYMYTLKTEQLPFLLWPEKGYSFLIYVALILITLLALFFGAGITGAILKLAGLFKYSDKMDMIISVFKTNYPLLVFTALTAGIVEELIFRGYLVPRLELLFGKPYIAVIVSSFIFGLGHLSYGTVANIAAPLVIGVIFAIHYQNYRNIKVLVACHFLYDLIVILARIKHSHH
jgi:membrane protease YdiL (CAAX protease family)